MKNNIKNFFLVDILMSFIVVFGVVMFLPMLPTIQGIFKVSVSQISWLPNIGYLTMIIFAILAGKIINKSGFKKLLLISLLLWIIGISIEIFAFSNLNYYIFVLGRFIEGIGEALIFPILLSMNRFVFKNIKNEKIGLSLIEFGGAFGGLISAIVAGKYLNSPKQFLIIPIVIGIITGVFIFIGINEVVTVKVKNQTQGIEKERKQESKKAFVSLLLMIFMIQMIFASIQVYLAYYMAAFSAANSTGLVLSIEQVLVAMGTIAPIFLLKHISFKGTRNMIILVFILGVSIIAMQLSVSISIVTFALIAFFVGVGFTTLNIYLSKVISTNLSQKVSLYTSIRFSGGFALSFCWGKLIEMYRGQGESYGQIFKHLNITSGIIVAVIFIATILLQREEEHLWKMESRQAILIEEI